MADDLATTSENKPERNELGQLLPGSTANPHGRPKGTVSITAAIKAKLEELYVDPDLPLAEKKTHLEKVIEAIFHNALKGRDARTLKDIWSYIDGLPKGTMAIEADKDSLATLTEFFRASANDTTRPKGI